VLYRAVVLAVDGTQETHKLQQLKVAMEIAENDSYHDVNASNYQLTIRDSIIHTPDAQLLGGSQYSLMPT
jgi:hypothetical protein